LIRYKRYEDQLVKTKANNRSAQEEFVAEVRPSSQCLIGIGSGFNWFIESGSRQAKLSLQKEKWRNFMFGEAECPLKCFETTWRFLP
jgi:hypothetical protein